MLIPTGGALAPLFAERQIRVYCGLDIERVERGLYQEEVDARVVQSLHLRGVSRRKRVEIHGARGRVIDVGRYARRLVHRPYRARDKQLLAPEFCRGPAGFLPRDFHRAGVHAAHEPLAVPVLGLHQKIRAESSGSHYVGTRLVVRAVDFRDYVGAREVQNVVVPELRQGV